MNHEESIKEYTKATDLISEIDSLEEKFINDVNKKQESILVIVEDLKRHGFYILSNVLEESVKHLNKKVPSDV